ncbi:MAG: 50S ribosomal protein L10, partial [Pirellulales bacterium]
KEVTRLASEDQFSPFAPRGGILDGERLTEEDVRAVSKWPTRDEQLSLLVGQILAPGAMLASQLTGPGSLVASQIESRGDEQEA